MKETIKTLLETGNKAIMAFIKKNLFGEEVNKEQSWTLPQVKKILKRQSIDLDSLSTEQLVEAIRNDRASENIQVCRRSIDYFWLAIFSTIVS